MKSILTIIFSFLLVVSGLAQTRNVVVGTNDVIVQPTNFWSANASNGRTGLGLGSAATNPASAFQPSSLTLSNIASSNIVSTALGGTGATNAGGARTNLGLGSTNNVIFNNIQFTSASISSGGLSIDTNNATFSGIGVRINNTNGLSFWGVNSNAAKNATRTNLGLGSTWLTNTDVTNFRTDIGLGPTNSPQFFNVVANGIVNSDDGNLVLDLVNWSLYAGTTSVMEWWTNYISFNVPIAGITVVSNQSIAVGIDSTNTVAINISAGGIEFEGNKTNGLISFIGTNLASTFRSDIGLGWSALTNSNAGTSLVSVDTNGNVVSPTNFWQVAPIQTLVQDFTGITVSQTNNANNARNVYVYSLATNVSGISNTIILPTNTSTFNGDEVTVIHKGTTNTTTVVRQAGSTNDLVTLNRFEESVKFIRELGQWDFYHNISFVEPIQFSGTNVSVNAAASRTNLGLGATNTPEFRGIVSSGNIIITNQSSTNNGLLFIYRTNTESFLGLANLIASNNTTVGNETLFRVGTSEATNKAAQFGFRSTNTNGDGVAVFSTFGYNALMMIGPSARSQTNAAIEADIYSVSPTNKVATLVDTNTGAFSLHRAIGFRTNETNGSPAGGGSAYADRDRWLEIYVGTNKFYIPLFE